MNGHGLLNNVEIRQVNDPVAAGSSTDDNSDIIDMADYESVMFITSITDSVDTGVATMTVEGNSANSDTGMAAISGAVATLTSEADDDLNGLLLAVEVHKPASRYLQAVLTSATANVAFGDTIAVLKPRRRPVTQGATVGASTFVSD
jgi:hypothetical protein